MLLRTGGKFPCLSPVTQSYFGFRHPVKVLPNVQIITGGVGWGGGGGDIPCLVITGASYEYLQYMFCGD